MVWLNQEKLSDTFVVVGGQILIGICGGIIRNLNGLTIQIKYILKIQKDSMKIILFTNGHIKKGKNTLKILCKNGYDEMRNYLEQIITLQTFMKSRDIPYIMFNSLYDVIKHDSFSKDNEYYPDGTNQIMWDDLVDKTFFYKPVFVDLTEPNKELWIRYNDTHPNKKA